MAERPEDNAEGVHDDPNKGDSESPEETLSRHEELHREHRERLDEHDEHVDEHHNRLSAIEKHLGLRGEEHKREERGEARERRRQELSERRRHD